MVCGKFRNSSQTCASKWHRAGRVRKFMPRKYFVFAAIVAAVLMLGGCSHRLQAAPGEHTVRVYPDEATFKRLKSLKHEGGAAALLGGFIGNNIASWKAADRTPVRIISQDAEGAEIEITDGPDKGRKGFVARGNLD